ncbi:uncharacterized protein LOC114353978 [Ostrinia furnacalis]|uniref:uncharacterized protein LOC114353978 n=1 Tax=Ostrinia furnacalis TaxID=93504 RepID=UPI001038E899|nr:uncharacterized protein LOC114353978 [Ostrinia furnacalis]
MGNSKSKKSAKEPDKFFERERWREQKRDEKRKKNANPLNKRVAVKEPPVPLAAMVSPVPQSAAVPAPPPAQVRSFDEEALELMRFQLRNDADAFLLNNILLSVQFFENYEREVQNIKNNPISEREHMINDAMVRHNKHVFFADRLQENVNEHVVYQKVRGQMEPLTSPRLFVIYDNVEASEPGDTSDYSAVLDAPFYKLRIEDCKEPGFVKLKKLEVLESTLLKENESVRANNIDSDDSVYTESEKESNDSDDSPSTSTGEALLQSIKNRLDTGQESVAPNVKLNFNVLEDTGRRRSGPSKQVSVQVEKNNILNISNMRKTNILLEEDERRDSVVFKPDQIASEDLESRPRKSILKNSRRLSGPTRDMKAKNSIFDARPISAESIITEDTETSGYRSNSSSLKTNDLSENESDYGYSTIKESTTPKRVELSSLGNSSHSSGVLPDETWTSVAVRAIDWTDDEDDDSDDNTSKLSLSRNLYDTQYYLCSVGFMRNFVDNFILDLGSVLGLSQDAINSALTQGASIYCDTLRNGNKIGNEVFPALIASWPNAANQWIIRERKIIQNPRTNFSYQWPTKYMVSKAMGFGCLLVPVGFRPKRGLNTDQKLQWKIIFPAAERYLESCLAHAHMRCYLFALTLQKSFMMEHDNSKMGIDVSHIKNHLFWQCEDNYAKWPEHRLGETLRIFLRRFYVHFGQGRFPNYFMENCNDFKSIPKPVLLKMQRRLADILEAPVMHLLSALTKLKYTKKEFYPQFNTQRLYEILTSKNPLRILNPNLPMPNTNYADSSDTDEEPDTNFWDKAKKHDKYYQWKKEKQKQLQERRKAQFYIRKQRASIKQEHEINTNIILPNRMEVERRRLVLEFFIPHFIAMARSSEKFEAIRQAVIYLEQAQRLCVLLKEEPAGEYTANEYLDVIRDKLLDCQRKLANQVGFKLPPRRESSVERSAQRPIRKLRPRYENITNQDSPSDSSGFSAFTFVEIHAESSSNQDSIRLNIDDIGEESKL